MSTRPNQSIGYQKAFRSDDSTIPMASPSRSKSAPRCGTAHSMAAATPSKAPAFHRDESRSWGGGLSLSTHRTVSTESMDSAGIQATIAPGAYQQHSFGHRFVVISSLGKGGMGEVWLCLDKENDNRKVAVKLLSPELVNNSTELRRFKENFEKVSKLNNPFIADVKELLYDRESRNYFIYMDYIDGLDVQDKYCGSSPREKFELQSSIRWLRQVADGLDSAYRSGLVHKDIKPSNLRIDGRGQARILDFGLADDAVRINDSHERLSHGGTPSFMSPEQLDGRGLDGRSDQYSLAVVIYLLLSGHLPFSPKRYRSHDAFRQAVLSEAPPPLPRVSPGVNQAVLRALSKNPEERFDTTSDFINALDERQYRQDKRNLFFGFVLFVLFCSVFCVLQRRQGWFGPSFSGSRVVPHPQGTEKTAQPQPADSGHMAQFQEMHRRLLQQRQSAEAILTLLTSPHIVWDTQLKEYNGTLSRLKERMASPLSVAEESSMKSALEELSSGYQRLMASMCQQELQFRLISIDKLLSEADQLLKAMPRGCPSAAEVVTHKTLQKEETDFRRNQNFSQSDLLKEFTDVCAVLQQLQGKCEQFKVHLQRLHFEWKFFQRKQSQVSELWSSKDPQTDPSGWDAARQTYQAITSKPPDSFSELQLYNAKMAGILQLLQAFPDR